MVVSLARVIFMISGTVAGYSIMRYVDWGVTNMGYPDFYFILVFTVLGGSIGYIIGGLLGREFLSQWKRVEHWIKSISPGELVLGIGGFSLGLLLSWIISAPLRLVSPSWVGILSTVLILLIGGYAGVSVVLWRSSELTRFLPIGDGGEVGEPVRILLLDTSAIIDARFAELRKEGFLPGILRVPGFVVAELQTLADSTDNIKRMRGRRGLDLLSTIPEGEITSFEVDYEDLASVDDKLLRLTEESGGLLVTTDYNLAKVAEVRGIKVLNINAAAVALRPNMLPGEKIEIKIVKRGKEPKQGVGYLEDGTMVVVQGGERYIGKDVQVEVTSVLRTGTGRMIFADAL